MKISLGLSGGAAGSFANKAGSWRSTRPVFLHEKCTGCQLCAVVCPDASVFALSKKEYTTDLDYCKGCGICAQECPVGDIVMKPEADYA